MVSSLGGSGVFLGMEAQEPKEGGSYISHLGSRVHLPGLVSQSRYHVPRSSKSGTFIFPQLWRLKIYNQGVGRVGFLKAGWEGVAPGLFPGLVGGCLLPGSALPWSILCPFVSKCLIFMKTHHIGFEPTLKCVVNQHMFGDLTSNLTPKVLALVIYLGSCHSFLTMYHIIALYKFKFWCMIAHKALSNGKPLQYSCLENRMDRGAWLAAVCGVAKSWIQLSDFSFTFTHWRRKWQPTPVFLPGESQGQGSLVGCRLWGRTESDTTEAT